MLTHKHFDRICVVIVLVAVIVTVLFMNGEAFGLTKIVDEDADRNEASQDFTANDLDGSWDTEGAATIRLDGADAVIEGTGAYMNAGSLYINSTGRFIVSGTLSDGSIIVDANDNSKVWILLDGVDIKCSDDAAIRVNEADKVFLTLAGGSKNTVYSGSEYSEEALADKTNGVIYAHDDLTINGSGALDISGGWKNGIDANDDLVIAGGTITITSASDTIHANDRLNIVNAVLELTAGDDAIHSEESVLVAGGKININECYEGIEAQTIEIRDGDITINCTDDGINAFGGSSSFGSFRGGLKSGDENGFRGGFGGFAGEATDSNSDGNDNQNMKHGGRSDKMQKKDSTENFMPGDGSERPEDSENFTPGDGSERPEMPEGFENFEPGDGSERPEMPEGSENFAPGGGSERPEMPEGSENFASGDGSEKAENFGSFGETQATGNAESSETKPTVTINGGKITIINSTGTDADGIDSNGDIIINGGEIYISLNGNGSNNAIDFGSENGGECRINGGIVVAAGGSSMLEAISSDSLQGSVTYMCSAAAGSEFTVKNSEGETIMSGTVPNAFTALTLSCPELVPGEGMTYTITVDGNSESISLDSVSGTFGSANGPGSDMHRGNGGFRRG